MKNYLFAFAACMSLAPQVHASGVRLKSLVTNGSGCPVGRQVPYRFNGEWLTLRVNQTFDMRTSKGPDIDLRESRKNCSVILSLQLPVGYRFAVERVVGWGDYQLTEGDQFTFTFDGFFQANGYDVRNEYTATAWGSQQKYTADHTFSGSQLVWSKCGREDTVTLDAAIQVGPNRPTWSTSTLAGVTYKFTYQKCS